jgi:hypothetical protein
MFNYFQYLQNIIVDYNNRINRSELIINYPHIKIVSSILLSVGIYNQYTQLKYLSYKNRTPSINKYKQLLYKNNTRFHKYNIIELTHGQTHYRTNIIEPVMLKNNNRYEIYVFIHTNKGSLEDYNNLISTLNNYQDFETINHTQSVYKYYLSYDLYGRGYSIYDNSPQTLQLYISQLSELLYSLDITCKINLIGWEMGANISAGFARVFPNKVKKLILLSPIGVPEYRKINNTIYHNLIHSCYPLLTLKSLYIYYNNKRLNISTDRDNGEHKINFKYIHNKIIEMYHNLNYLEFLKIQYEINSIKSYEKYFPMGEITEIYNDLNSFRNNKILICWGIKNYNRQDLKIVEAVKIQNPNAELIIYHQFTENFPMENTEDILRSILSYTINNNN